MGLLLGLKRGSQGENVRALQTHLNLHEGAKVRADGEYGPLVVLAVRQLQARHRLEVTGEVDAATEALIQERAAVLRGSRDVLPLGLRDLVEGTTP